MSLGFGNGRILSSSSFSPLMTMSAMSWAFLTRGAQLDREAALAVLLNHALQNGLQAELDQHRNDTERH